MPEQIEYALTPMQHGMLYHTLRSPGTGVYIAQLSMRISGAEIDVDAFRRAWQEEVGQHDALRTAFHLHGRSQPVQVVHPHVTVPLSQHDWRHRTSDEQAVGLEHFLLNDRMRGFDFSQAPLMRLALLRMADDRFQLIWSLHHAILDGWSTHRVLAEAFQRYEICRVGRSLHLNPPRPYRDYVGWLERQDLAAAETFWRHELKGFIAPTPFGVDRPAHQAHHEDLDVDERRVQFSPAMTRDLRYLARRLRITLNTLIQGTWALLLSCYSGEQDVIFGVTVTGRDPELAGVESMIGLLINTLPFRANVRPEETLESYLQTLLRTQGKLLPYQHTPLVKAQAWSEVPRGLPLFESVLVFQNLPAEQIGPSPIGQDLVDDTAPRSSLEIGPIDLPERTGYPLTVVTEPGIELTIRLIYDTRRFDDAVIERMAGQIQTLMQGMVANPEARLAELPLLTALERRRLLVTWNERETDYPRDRCLHELFEEQVDRTPDATALISGDELLTYQELNRRANQVAHCLQQRGVGPEVLVGIHIERSLELVVGLLGILKAGGAYVPLDPSYPRERLAFMLDDAAVPVLLTRLCMLGGLPEYAGNVVCLDQDEAVFAEHPHENPRSGVRAENLAYVIYTSGSTGKPKGVMAPQRGAINRLCWMWQAYPFGPGEIACHKTSISFVDHVWEIFGPLLRGVPLVIVPEGVEKDPGRLIDLLNTSSVTRIVLVPSLLRALLYRQESLPSQSLGVKYLLVSGETLDVSLLDRCRESIPSGTILNLYGSSEVAGDATWYDSRDPRPAQTVPIGRPIANTQVYILNRELEAVPIGVPGELHVGGDGLARGYLNRPELTAQRFVPNPFSEEAGARLYKTGDLGRYLPDGSIEFLGRLDRQVKIRGIRIEPGEVEALLVQHREIREAYVMPREWTAGDTRLVAYIVPVDEPPSSKELRSFLEVSVPEYMVPSAFVPVDSIPLGPNGKVDCKALPDPDAGSHDYQTEYVSPRTVAEHNLATIWQEILGIQRIGVLDRFLELGGDSLLAMQVVTRSRSAGFSFSVQQLVEHPTIAELADLAGCSPAIGVEQGIVIGPVPLMPRQRRFLQGFGAGRLRFQVPPPLPTRERLDPALLERAVLAMLAHHDALRMDFTYTEQGWQQWNPGMADVQVFRYVDVGDRSEAEQLAAMQEEALRIRAEGVTPGQSMIRVCLFNHGSEQVSHVMLCVHHLTMDAFSMRILLEDLSTAYRQLKRGEEIRLPAKTASFKAWAERLADYAQSDELAAEIPYWLSEERRQVAPLPVDYPGATHKPGSNRIIARMLDQDSTQALLQELPRLYGTEINDVLLTALALTLREWTGSSSLLVELDSHGREAIFADVEVSRTVGWFTSVFPVLLDVGETTEPGEALLAIKEQLRAIPKRGIGYGLLCYTRDDPSVARQLAGLPQAGVGFNYQGQLDQIFGESALFLPPDEITQRMAFAKGGERAELRVVPYVLGRQLGVDFKYSHDLYKQSTVESIAETYVDLLHRLIGRPAAVQTVR